MQEVVALIVSSFIVGVNSACGIVDTPNEDGLRPAQVLWQAGLPAFGPPGIDDSSVFFSLRDHRIAAVNRATGAVRWTKGSGQTGSNLVTQNTPLRADEVVVFWDEHLYAWDAVTGDLRWTFGNDDVAARVGVYPFKTDGVRIYAGSAIGSAFAVDVATGAQVWRVDLLPTNDSQVRIMSVRDGRVYLCIRYDGLAYSGKVYALNAVTGATAWSYELPKVPGLQNGTIDAVLSESQPSGTLFIVSFDDGRIVALDGLTGTPRWTIPRPSGITSQNDIRSLTVSGGVSVATSTGPITSPASISHRAQRNGVRCLIKGRHSIFRAIPNWPTFRLAAAISRPTIFKTGARRWLRSAPTGLFHGAPVVSRDTLFIGGCDAAFAVKK